MSRNAYKGGTRDLLRTLARVLREQRRRLVESVDNLVIAAIGALSKMRIFRILSV